MLVATIRRRRVTLPMRICTYLATLQGPCHYTTIARRLHIARVATVGNTCVRMAHDGRLRWCGEGLYERVRPPQESRRRTP